MECQATTKTTNEQILNGRRGIFRDEDKLSEFYNCVFMKLGVQSSDGTLQPNKLKSLIPYNVRDRSLAEKVIKECVELNKNVPSKKMAIEIFRCYIKNFRV